MTDQNKITALIKLLDDPDEQIFEHIKDEIVKFGTDVIPHLEQAWEFDSFGHLFQERIEDIIHSIQFELVKEELKEWACSEEKDLLQGLIIISRYQYPELDEVAVRQKIEQLRKDVWLELNSNLMALERIKVMNHIFFEHHGFAGNTLNYHSPQNSFINDVLDSKKGNPILLSSIYLIVAEQLKLPIYGVNLPQHFIVAYLKFRPQEADFEYLKDDVLFYVNPFSKGQIFQFSDIEKFLLQLNLPVKESYYLPCDHLDILMRCTANLIHAFEKQGYKHKADEILELRQILQQYKP